MKRLLFALLFCMGLLPLFSAETIVRGVLAGNPDTDIDLYQNTDYITWQRNLMETVTTDSTGAFEIKINHDKILHVIMVIGYFEGELYFEPGEIYELKFGEIKLKDQFRPFYNAEPLPFTISNENEYSLNNCIWSFNIEFNEFTLNNFNHIYKQRNSSMIDSLTGISAKLCPDTQNEYLDNYMFYRIGTVEIVVRSTIRDKMFNKYFKERPILYDHIEFMYFFNEFFDRYYNSSRFIDKYSLKDIVNNGGSLLDFSNELGNDTLLVNERFRELVAIKMLFQLSYEKGYKRHGITEILMEIANQSKFRIHREIAASVAKKVLWLTTGTPAPEFILHDLDDMQHSLSDFSGKPVFLAFFTTQSFGCLAEMDIFNDLFDKFREEINFVAVSFNEDLAMLETYMTDKQYKWTVLIVQNKKELVRLYDIKTFPLFVLIDENGSIMQYPARKPSENIEYVLQNLLNK